ncbi:NAD dependent epimerase/dehydratase [Mycena galericulata]|nr:NAD dependent epimerase/dehydratase [Mycena galericulata]
MPRFLITTATGVQGTSTARLLLAKGAEVNALVRDPTSKASLRLQTMGATLFKGDFDDVPAITAAMQGVTGVFLNTFPSEAREARQAETVVAAARAAGTVQSFVVSTSYRANLLPDWDVVKADFPFLAQYFSSKAGVEHVIRAAGFTYTILRPGWLMSNFIGGGPAYQFPEYISARVMTVSYPRDFRQGYFDPADVGKFAAAALLDPARFAGVELNLVYEWLTSEEIAAHLSAAIGKEVTVKYRTEQETAEAMKTLGTTQIQVWEPTAKPVVDTAKLADYGFRLGTFKEFLEREKSAIRETVGVKD